MADLKTPRRSLPVWLTAVLVACCGAYALLHVTGRTKAAHVDGSGLFADWGPEANGVKCRIELDRTEYRIGETVNVQFEIRNVGAGPVSFGCVELNTSATQRRDPQAPTFFFSSSPTDVSQFPGNSKFLRLGPGRTFAHTVKRLPWGPTRSSIPPVASPGKMAMEGLVIFRPRPGSRGWSAETNTVHFTACE